MLNVESFFWDIEKNIDNLASRVALAENKLEEHCQQINEVKYLSVRNTIAVDYVTSQLKTSTVELSENGREKKKLLAQLAPFIQFEFDNNVDIKSLRVQQTLVHLTLHFFLLIYNWSSLKIRINFLFSFTEESCRIVW